MNFQRRKTIVACSLVAVAAGFGGAVYAAFLPAPWYVILMLGLFSLNALALAAGAAEKSLIPNREKRFDFFAFSNNGGFLANAFLWVMMGMFLFYLSDRVPILGYSVYGLIAAAIMLVRGLRAGFRFGRFQKTRNVWDRFEYEQRKANVETRQIYRCPRCGQMVYEDQEICEKCGNIFIQDIKKRK